MLHMEIAKIQDLLVSRNIKPTKVRTALYELLHNTKEPLSADSICDALKKAKQSVHRATVYRDLNLFLEKKIVKKITLIGEHAELFLLDKTHKHLFKCLTCNNIEFFDTSDIDTVIESFIKKKEKSKGWLDASFSFKIYGQCKKCAKKRKDIS